MTVSVPFAVECFADLDVFLVLRDDAKLPFVKVHSFSQGEVVNDLLVRGKAQIGLVDEDPGKSHHGHRDDMDVVATTTDVELRRGRGKLADRHLLLLKPDLEGCFRRSLKLVGMQAPADDLHRALALPNARHPHHVRFREQLAELRKHPNSFIATVERELRKLFAR